jgi:DNA-binding XRE family transcriptional regulator
MKTSGKTQEYRFNFKINVREFDGMHRDEACKGEWKITITSGPARRFTLDALGPVPVPLIPLVTCHECHTSYEVPKFREFVEEIIARHLVTSKEALTKKQIRFLRLFFNQTQEELASHIGVADRHEMAKMESEKSERTLGADRQVRLKLHCAKLLKLVELNQIFELNDIDDSRSVEISEKLFPQTPDELDRALAG